MIVVTLLKFIASMTLSSIQQLIGVCMEIQENKLNVIEEKSKYPN